MKQQKIWVLTETVRYELNRTFVAAFARKPSHKKLLGGGYLGKYASDQSIADLLRLGISDPDMFDTWFCLDRVKLN